jgi:hypothetical protein
MTIDRSELIRDAFQGDSLVATDRERLWSATQQRITRQARAKLMVRAGLFLLAGLVIAAAVYVLHAIRSPSAARLSGTIAIAADSIMISTDSMERSMTRTQEQVPNDLIPLLGHRSGLQTELRHLENRQLELSQAVEKTSGRERNVMENQLKSVEQQIEATRVAISAIDAQLSGKPTVAHTLVEAFPPPPEPPQVFQFGSSGLPDGFVWAAGGIGTFLVLAMIAMMGFMRKIARTTRQALSAIETQVSSQHATLASGIDAIAVEVERLGEGQRFMSKVLSSPDVKVPIPKSS